MNSVKIRFVSCPKCKCQDQFNKNITKGQKWKKKYKFQSEWILLNSSLFHIQNEFSLTPFFLSPLFTPLTFQVSGRRQPLFFSFSFFTFSTPLLSSFISIDFVFTISHWIFLDLGFSMVELGFFSLFFC